MSVAMASRSWSRRPAARFVATARWYCSTRRIDRHREICARVAWADTLGARVAGGSRPDRGRSSGSPSRSAPWRLRPSRLADPSSPVDRGDRRLRRSSVPRCSGPRVSSSQRDPRCTVGERSGECLTPTSGRRQVEAFRRHRCRPRPAARGLLDRRRPRRAASGSMPLEVAEPSCWSNSQIVPGPGAGGRRRRALRTSWRRGTRERQVGERTGPWADDEHGYAALCGRPR